MNNKPHKATKCVFHYNLKKTDTCSLFWIRNSTFMRKAFYLYKLKRKEQVKMKIIYSQR